MMNKKIKLIVIITVLFLLIIALRAFIRSQNPSLPPVNINTSNNPPDIKVSPALPPVSYNVVSVLPVDGTKNVPPDTDIKVSFDQKLIPELIDFAIAPAVVYDIKISSKTLVIKPVTQLKPGTEYTYIIKYKNNNLPSSTYTFVTIGQFNGPEDTYPEGAREQEAAFLIGNHPDVFLSNLTPYNSSSFDLNSEFINPEKEETGRFQFTFIAKSEDARIDFLSWTISLGMTEEQVNSLDIIY